MKPLQLALIISATLIGGAILLTLNKSGAQEVPATNNVSIVDGQQIIDITAKGGYTPRTSTAKAGIPTVLRFHTNGTFDCSSYIRIPSMGVSQALPSTGTVDIAVTDPKAGALIGMCGMGMYPFQVNFQS
ncbi:MAG: cupredoxin domain-containing protein [Patescibacteria group bacterium]